MPWEFLTKPEWLPHECEQVLARMAKEGMVCLRDFVRQEYGNIDEGLCLRAVARLEFQWQFGSIKPIWKRMEDRDSDEGFYSAIDRLRYGDVLQDNEVDKIDFLKGRGILLWCGPESGIASVRKRLKVYHEEDREADLLDKLDACIFVGLEQRYLDAWRAERARAHRGEREDEAVNQANDFLSRVERADSIKAVLMEYCPELVESFDLWAARFFFLRKEVGYLLEVHLLEDSRYAKVIAYQNIFLRRKEEFLWRHTDQQWRDKVSSANEAVRGFGLACFAHQSLPMVSNSDRYPNTLMDIVQSPLPELQRKWNCTRVDAVKKIAATVNGFMRKQYSRREMMSEIADKRIVSETMDRKLRRFMGLTAAKTDTEHDLTNEP